MNFHKHKIIPFLILLVIGLLVYSNSFDNSFHFDDFPNIVNALSPKSLGSTLTERSRIFGDFRFVGKLSFALNYYFHGLDVWGYHLVNILFHIFTSYLVFLVASIVFRLAIEKDFSGQSKRSEKFGLLVALIFLVHPIQTQPVNYIVQRITILAAFFYLASLWFYLKGRVQHQQKNFNKRHVYSFYLAAAITGILGLHSKEFVATLPAIILLSELILFTAQKNRTQLIKKLSMYGIATLVIAGILISYLSPSYIFSTKTSPLGEEINSYNYLLTQFRVIPKYFSLLIVPVNQVLAYYFPISKSLINPWTTAAGLALNVSLVTWALANFWKKKLLAFAILWFFITLAIESSIIPIQDVIFEHRLYLPMIGFALLLAWQMLKMIEHNKRLGWTLVIVVISTYSLISFNRNLAWKTEVSIWSDVVRKSPKNIAAYEALAIAYQNEGQFDQAIQYHLKVLTTDSMYALTAHNNLGLIFMNLQDFDQAIYHYRQSIMMVPDDSEVHNQLGVALIQNGNLAEGIIEIEKSLELDPNNQSAQGNLELARTMDE